MAHSMACQAWQAVEPSHYHSHYLRGFKPQCQCAVQALKHSVVSIDFLWQSLGFGGGATNWFSEPVCSAQPRWPLVHSLGPAHGDYTYL